MGADHASQTFRGADVSAHALSYCHRSDFAALGSQHAAADRTEGNFLSFKRH